MKTKKMSAVLTKAPVTTSLGSKLSGIRPVEPAPTDEPTPPAEPVSKAEESTTAVPPEPQRPRGPAARPTSIVSAERAKLIASGAIKPRPGEEITPVEVAKTEIVEAETQPFDGFDEDAFQAPAAKVEEPTPPVETEQTVEATPFEWRAAFDSQLSPDQPMFGRTCVLDMMRKHQVGTNECRSFYILDEDLIPYEDPGPTDEELTKMGYPSSWANAPLAFGAKFTRHFMKLIDQGLRTKGREKVDGIKEVLEEKLPGPFIFSKPMPQVLIDRLVVSLLGPTPLAYPDLPPTKWQPQQTATKTDQATTPTPPPAPPPAKETKKTEAAAKPIIEAPKAKTIVMVDTEAPPPAKVQPPRPAPRPRAVAKPEPVVAQPPKAASHEYFDLFDTNFPAATSVVAKPVKTESVKIEPFKTAPMCAERDDEVALRDEFPQREPPAEDASIPGMPAKAGRWQTGLIAASIAVIAILFATTKANSCTSDTPKSQELPVAVVAPTALPPSAGKKPCLPMSPPLLDKYFGQKDPTNYVEQSTDGSDPDRPYIKCGTNCQSNDNGTIEVSKAKICWR